MNQRTFYYKVVQMRQAQRTFEQKKSPKTLADKLRLEREIDNEIQRVNDLFASRQPKQTTLEL